MKRCIVALSLLALLAAGAGVAGELAWFDMENCAMCSNINDPAMLKSMNWEQHKITNGVVAVTTIDEKYLDAYRAAHMKMEATGERMMKGEQLAMCGSCNALGACFMKGASHEYVKTSTGDVMLFTSDNAEVVAALHEWAERNKKEMAKFSEKG